MKLRIGFVSNSSSASFVLIGVRIDERVLIEMLGDDYYEELRKLGLDMPSEAGCVGKLISVSYEGESSEIEWELDKLNEAAKDVSTVLSIPLSDIKLIFGVMSC